MNNISEKANDSIELCAIILGIYKKARDKNMYIIDRPKSNAFAITLKEMQLSYDGLSIPFERFFDEKEIKKEERQQYEYSKENIEKIKQYEEFVTEATKNLPKNDEEAQRVAETIERQSMILQGIKPELVARELPLYINNVSGLECPLIALKDLSDDNLSSIASMNTEYVLHSKYFAQGYQQKDTVLVEFFKVGEWYDAVCV